MTGRRREALALGAWTSFLVVALTCLHALGGGPLGAPPVRGVGRWLADRDAATAVFGLLRLTLLAAGWYLLVATVLAIGLRLLRAEGAARAVEACAPAPIGRLVRAAAGLSLAASVVAGSAAAASEADQPITMRRLPDAVVPVVEGESETVTMTRLPDVDSTTPTTVTSTPSTWTVAPGDHLWSIARRALAAAWRIEPTDAEVDPYWRELIERNRRRLPDPTNPDLIVPDLVLELPATPSR